jgi:hypothetical protein
MMAGKQFTLIFHVTKWMFHYLIFLGLLASPRTRNRYLQVPESFSKDVFNLD